MTDNEKEIFQKEMLDSLDERSEALQLKCRRQSI
jgi:hypothetical protein